MAELTASQVVQVLNRLHPHDVIYILDEAVEGNPIPALVYACAKHDTREGLYTVTERLTLEDAVQRISVVLSMEVEANYAG